MLFLINTLTHWNEPPRARHQVAYTLSKEHKVIFVAAVKPGLPGIKSAIIKENLEILTPYYPILHKIRYRIPFINEIYQNWLFRRLKKKYSDYVVINFDFTATRIYNYFTNVIYYCNDSFSAISKHINPFFIAKYHQRCESQVAARARFCIAVSPMLRDNLLKYNQNSFEIPLGSPDIEQYNIPVKEIMVDNEIIHVGLMGFIKLYNISYQAINYILQDDKIQLTLIGPVENKFLEQIKRKDRLTMTGSLTGESLYKEINKFDVTIAPYSARLTKDNKSGVGTGSKIYHYLAMGKPVVISYMAGLSKINLPDGFLYIAKSDKEFPDLIHKAKSENTKKLIRQRIDFAMNNTWTKRMEDFIAYIQRFEKS
jgi:hypothetical protein